MFSSPQVTGMSGQGNFMSTEPGKGQEKTKNTIVIHRHSFRETPFTPIIEMRRKPLAG
jgi:hypothetical protein